jgi:transposase
MPIMNPYSMDLRERVVESYELGHGTQSEVAQNFDVSRSSVQKWLRKSREDGSVAAAPHGGGRPATFSGRNLEKLAKLVKDDPDATLEELLHKSGIKASVMSVFRALERLDITRKKRS